MSLGGSVLGGAVAGCLLLSAEPTLAESELASGPAFGTAPSTGIFRDVARQVGLDFTHFNGMTGKFYFPEMTGQGGAVFDYDGDGDLDVYLVQGSLLTAGETMANALFPLAAEEEATDRLFRNDSYLLGDGELELQFVDVSDQASISAPGYGMGAAVGDLDNDGWLDLYVTNYGPNQLFRNRGNGTFEDVTERSGTGDPLWGTSAVFFDFDNDDWQDLYVANYVLFDAEENPKCFAASSRDDYCGPDAFEAQPDRLFRNRRDGTFEDVTTRALPGYVAGPGLGAATADFNADGQVDLYVANDGRVNQLWLNRGNGTFVDEALFAGVGLNRSGRPEASMGVDVADFDGDGDEDIFLTHLMGETNTLYVNDGSGLFEDRTIEHGLAGVSLPHTSFGTSWIDVDNDGLLDLLIASGAVRILEDQAAAGDRYPLKQANLLLRNTGGRFEDISSAAGESFALLGVSRGVSLGDLDNDGDRDVVLHNNNGPARLLLNQVGSKSHWIGLGVRSGDSFAVRDRVEVTTSDGVSRWRRARTDGSFCSSKDPRVIVGMGAGGGAVSLVLHDRNGRRRLYSSIAPDHYLVVYDARSP